MTTGSTHRFIRQELRLQARDIGETIAFYRDVLGFTVDTTCGPEGDLEERTADVRRVRPCTRAAATPTYRPWAMRRSFTPWRALGATEPGAP
jgi:hypothetical protein